MAFWSKLCYDDAYMFVIFPYTPSPLPLSHMIDFQSHFLSNSLPCYRILDQSVCLRVIDLSGNTNMGSRGCLSVILSCSRVRTLKQLKLVGCGMSSPLPDHVWQEIDLSSLALLDLSDNTLDERDRTSILKCWGDALVSTTSSFIFVLHCKWLVLVSWFPGHILLSICLYFTN